MPEHHDSAETIARWLEQQTGREVRFEKVEAGDERVLPAESSASSTGALGTGAAVQSGLEVQPGRRTERPGP